MSICLQQKLETLKPLLQDKSYLYKAKSLGKKLKKRIKSKEIIGKAMNNMNNTQSEKYDLEPEVIEKFKV